MPERRSEMIADQQGEQPGEDHRQMMAGITFMVSSFIIQTPA
jgi:hypothetical protein